MKVNQFKSYLLIAILLIGKASYAGFFEETKTINCAYKVGSAPSIELSNQYGEIQIITWEKDSVKLEAIITATSDKIQDIEKLMGRVDVICRGTTTTVLVSTEWTEGVGFLNKGSMDLKNMLNSDKKLIVNYKVYLPITSRLNIKNRFGDVYLPNYTGPLRVDLSHGDLRARDIKDGRSISVKYGKVLIKNLEQGLLKLAYGNLILDKANNLTLESKSSTIEILEVNRLAIQSRNDELRIDKVNSLRGEATFTHLLAKQLTSLLDLNTSYGDLIVKEIAQKFELVRLDGYNTDYDLEFHTKSAFQFSLETANERGTSFPINAEIKEEEIEKNIRRYSGNIGANTSTSKVVIKQKSGYLNLFVR